VHGQDQVNEPPEPTLPQPAGSIGGSVTVCNSPSGPFAIHPYRIFPELGITADPSCGTRSPRQVQSRDGCTAGGGSCQECEITLESSHQFGCIAGQKAT
jgi:hypothetical protein